jgi:hypothetical protein
MNQTSLLVPNRTDFHWKLRYTNEGRIDYSDLFPIDHPHLPPYFDFEKTFDFISFGNFFHKYWYISFVTTFFYLGGAFGLQHFMKNRPPYRLKWSLVLWNAALGVFSIIGFSRTLPSLLYKLALPDGFYRTLCVP